MKRWNLLLPGLALAVALGAAFSPAEAGTSLSVNLRIGDPYPRGELVFRDEPDIVMVPDTRVYYVRNSDYDVFRYGRYWYLCDEGVWFRARTHRGPFKHISFTTVPRAVVYVPEKHWRHWRGHPGRGYARGHYQERRPDAVVIQDRHPGRGPSKHGKK
jgi:hypothetical protein